MKSPFKKLHLSEILLLVIYALLFASFFLHNEEDRGYIMLFCFVFITVVSIWSLIRLRSLSPTLWPLYIFFGYAMATFLGSNPSSGPGAAISVFLFLVLVGYITFQLVCSMILATKDAPKAFLLVFLSFIISFGIDATFITTNEIGERGCAYALEKHAAWRVLCK